VLNNMGGARQGVTDLLSQLAAAPGATSEVQQLASFAASGRG
jgi:hypothetical protein